MNPLAIIVILLGMLLIIVGVKGTQGNLVTALKGKL